MQTLPWRGVFPAVTTKSHADESLDLDGTARHIDFQIRNGIHGVVCCGSLGEASTLTLEEKLAVARCALDASAGRVPVLATVSETSTREALRWITVEGARMLGQLDRIGTLAPGKQADLVLVRADTLNMQPLHDPASALVLQASLANIDAVMVAGRWRKRDGRLLGVDLPPLLRALRASAEKITKAMGLGAP